LVEGGVGPEEKPRVPWDMYKNTTPTESAREEPIVEDERFKEKYPASNFQG
jgi:hypothetical protein